MVCLPDLDYRLLVGHLFKILNLIPWNDLNAGTSFLRFVTAVNKIAFFVAGEFLPES